MIDIRPQFLEYLKSLGFTEAKIAESWRTVQETIYTDYFTLEIMTRDLLQRPEATLKTMQQFLKKMV